MLLLCQAASSSARWHRDTPPPFLCRAPAAGIRTSVRGGPELLTPPPGLTVPSRCPTVCEAARPSCCARWPPRALWRRSSDRHCVPCAPLCGDEETKMRERRLESRDNTHSTEGIGKEEGEADRSERRRRRRRGGGKFVYTEVRNFKRKSAFMEIRLHGSSQFQEKKCFHGNSFTRKFTI